MSVLLPINYGVCDPCIPCDSSSTNVPSNAVYDPVEQIWKSLLAPDGVLTVGDSVVTSPSSGGCGGGSVPGPQGTPGTPGTPGVGINAYTTVLTGFTVPAISSTVPVVVGSTLWMAIGQPVFIATAGVYLVSGITDANDVVITNLGYAGNAVAGTIIAPANKITPTGLIGPDGAAGGGVTSVALSAPSVLTVSGSPITTSGTLAFDWATGQLQNRVLASPNGSTGQVSLRVLVAADIPNLDATKITTGTLGISNGGTGQSTQSTAFNALSPTTIKGDIAANTGSGNTRVAVGSDGTVLTANSGSTPGMQWAAPAIALTTTRRRVSATPDVMQATDSIIGVNVASAVSETLIAAPANGRRVTIKDESGAAASAKNITVLAGAGDTIEGSASKVITTNYGFLNMYYDATDKIWFVIGSA